MTTVVACTMIDIGSIIYLYVFNASSSEEQEEEDYTAFRLPCGIEYCLEKVSKARYFSYHYYYL
jgi:hypothetical protein